MALLMATTLPALAAAPADVVINEVAWMGTTTSSNDEWLELKNTTDAAIDLSGWQLNWDGGAVELSGSIAPGDYYLLERTDDDSVPGIAADLIYSGSLGNAGENLVLLDNDGNVIDSTDFATGWPAGDNTAKLTMERTCPISTGNDPASWQTGLDPNGTPAEENSVCLAPPVLECTPLQLSHTCQSDGWAEITYGYNDPSCGENFTQNSSDQNCACNYSDWLNESCAGDNLRQQTRTESSGLAYCTAELSRQISDPSCAAPTDNDLVTYAGTGCLLLNKSWQCDRTSLIKLDTGADTITVLLPVKNISENFQITKTKSLKIITLYQAQNGQKNFWLLINTRNEQVFGIGQQLKFRGKL